MSIVYARDGDLTAALGDRVGLALLWAPEAAIGLLLTPSAYFIRRTIGA